MGTIFAYFYHAPLDNSRRYNKFDRRAANLNLTSNSSWGHDGGLSKCPKLSLSCVADLAARVGIRTSRARYVLDAAVTVEGSRDGVKAGVP